MGCEDGERLVANDEGGETPGADPPVFTVTEGERRRARLEVERPVAKTDKGDAVVESYRTSLGIVKQA